ncbi:MAG: phage portal protein [Candidatus Woesearchaeota archaeon]
MKINLFNKRSKNISIPFDYFNTLQVYSGLDESNNVVVFCSQLIKNVVSSLPIILYYKGKDGEKRIAGWHNLYRIVKYKPNIYEPSVSFYSLLVSDLIKYGNTFIYKVKDTNGNISQLIRIDPEIVKIKVSNFNKYFEIGGKEYTIQDIVHIPASLGYDGVQGKGVLEYAKNTIATSNEVQNFLRFIFNNSFFSKLKLNLNDSDYRNLDINKIKEILDFFSYLFSGQNLGKPLTEFKGVRIETIEHKNNTDELYKNREFLDRQICNFFNVPYELLSGQNKYNSVEQFNQFFIQTCLNQYTDRIAQYFNQFLLTELEQQNYFFEFEFTELLTTDVEKYSNMLINQLKNGIISINEARQKLNMNKIDNNAANTNFIIGVGIVKDDVFESWGAKSKMIQKEIEQNE